MEDADWETGPLKPTCASRLDKQAEAAAAVVQSYRPRANDALKRDASKRVMTSARPFFFSFFSPSVATRRRNVTTTQRGGGPESSTKTSPASRSVFALEPAAVFDRQGRAALCLPTHRTRQALDAARVPADHRRGQIGAVHSLARSLTRCRALVECAPVVRYT